LIPTSINGPDEIAHVRAVVLTWNGAHLLPECLRSIEAQTVPVKVTVVDNASTDETAALLARDFPRVLHLRLTENLGYGRANNEAMRCALETGAEFIALVNNDVDLDPDWLESLLAAAKAHPEAGLFCGTLQFKNEPAVNSTGLEIDALGRARDRDFRVPLAELRREDGPVAGVSGGAALLRASMLREIGLFDSEYFAYYEDVDLSLRAAERGIGSWYVRDAVARHRFGASFGAGSPQQRFLLGRGHLRTLALHQPLPKALALIPLTMAYRLWVKAPLDLLQSRPRHALAEVKAAAAGGLSAAKVLLSGRSRSRR
jgi:N-acetylglucosaminyl-diphospho-decaprenol L-rhamnosyltransferase